MYTYIMIVTVVVILYDNHDIVILSPRMRSANCGRFSKALNHISINTHLIFIVFILVIITHIVFIISIRIIIIIIIRQLSLEGLPEASTNDIHASMSNNS